MFRTPAIFGAALLASLPLAHAGARRAAKTQHRFHHGRRPRQRRPRLSRASDQHAQYRQARHRGRPARGFLRHAGLYALARGADDRPLRDALRAADAGHFSEPHLWAGDGRADAAAGPERGGLQDADGRQVAPRPCRPEILAAEPRLRLFLRQCRRRGRLFHPRARRPDRLAAQRRRSSRSRATTRR